MIRTLAIPAAVVAAFCAVDASASGTTYFSGAGLKVKASPGTVGYGGAYYGPYYSSGGEQSPVQHSSCGPLGVCDKCDEYYGRIVPDEGKSCSDGLYCNGEEHCDHDGKCVSGPAVDCSTAHFPNFSDQCGDRVCSEKYHKCTIEIHPGECDDHDSCTVVDTCQITDGSCSGIPRRCPFDCYECSHTTGDCEYICGVHEVCEHDTCVPAPPPPPECHTASDCADPGCQDCSTTGHCVDALHKDKCTCPDDACRGCEACKVTELIINGDEIVRETYCTPDPLCCHSEHDCDYPACQDCSADGFCVDAPEKHGCECDGDAEGSCRGCETCVVKAIDAPAHKTKSFDCIDEDFTCCNSDHDCAFPDCQACDLHDGACGAAVDKETCTCPDPEPDCGHCHECSVLSIVDAHAQTVHTGCAPVPDESCGQEVCEEAFDVYCYKCGSQPLSCLVLGDPSHTELTAIHEALQGDCDASTQTDAIGTLLAGFKPKTSAGQQCKSGIITAAAPKDTYGEECLFPMGDHLECPIVDDGLHNVGRYTVCLNHVDGQAVAEVVNDETEDKSELVCGGPHDPCHVSDCPSYMPECTYQHGYCPEPTVWIE